MMPLPKTTEADSSSHDELLVHILEGFRFQVCQDPWQAAQALEVRRQVYLEDSGYEIPIPDEYDRRSWLITATEISTGRIVGSIRVTPRFGGTLEAEEYFTLPAHLRTPKAYEISRFAILPAYRKGKTFLPVVSLGLFKTVQTLLERVGAHYMVICAKPERVWTFEWIRFEHTGLVRGKVQGQLKATGVRPKFEVKLARNGVKLPDNLFASGIAHRFGNEPRIAPAARGGH